MRNFQETLRSKPWTEKEFEGWKILWRAMEKINELGCTVVLIEEALDSTAGDDFEDADVIDIGEMARGSIDVREMVD